MSNNIGTNTDIQKLFSKNAVDDLQLLFKRRHCLNNTNIFFMRITDILNAVGVFTATIGVGYNSKEISLIGIGLNVMGLLLTKCTQTNEQLSTQMLHDIINIKNNNYIDESNLVFNDDVKKYKSLDNRDTNNKDDIINTNQVQV
jgi:hypothetical protein